MEQKFEFTSKFKIPLYILMGIGLLAVIASFILYHDHGARFWANFLMDNIYFILIGVAAIAFFAIHSLGTSGWQTSIQRIPEAMSMYLPVGAVFMFIILIGMWFNMHHLYHWAHYEGHDAILEAKKGFLNIPFFSIRTAFYLGLWIFFAFRFRKLSVQMDTNPDLSAFRKMNISAGIFMVLFAITSSTSAWDWIMSLDPHWYSTLFGWYIFAGSLASGTSMIALIVILLKRNGYLPHVNKEHLHDLGKYIFGFSILWTYLWFSQFMLIWYGNIPEETIYFHQRLDGFRVIFFVNLLINFVFPFLALMTRNAKRMPGILAIVSIVVLIGHWIDFFMLVMPATMGKDAGIGFVEIGMALGFVGIFLYVVLRSVAKANLVPVHHPYLKESFEYHTQY